MLSIETDGKTTKYTGPKDVAERAIARRSIPKYGAEKTTHCRGTRADDVFMEFVVQEDKQSVPNGLYMAWAGQMNWPDADILEIMRSEEPQEVFLRMFCDAMCIARKSKASKANTSSSSSSTTTTTRGMNLKDRINLRQKTDTVTEKDTSAPAKPGSKTLNDRMSTAREQGKRREDDSTIVISNVPLEYDENDIKDELFDFALQRVSVARRDDAGNGHRASRGIAYIVLTYSEDVSECMEFLSRARWDHHVLAVEIAKPKGA